jgi:hypothetical protein
MNAISYIRTAFYPATNSAEKRGNHIENFVLLLWMFSIFASVLNHEMWRDETREFLMATGTKSFAEYFNFAKYDGHPLLWRTVLMAFYFLIPHPVVLQMASIIAGFVTIYMLVKHSPFPLIFKTLFIFGVIPFSVNTVDARDYGISMLLFFASAILYPKAERHPLVMGILLFLQANTNQYGMYLSGLFLACWIADSGFSVLLKDKRYLAAAGIALTGIFISIYSTRADAESVFITKEFVAKLHFSDILIKAVLHPGEYIWYIVNFPEWVRDALVVVLVIGLIVIRPCFGMTLWVAITFFNIVGAAFIYPQTRHQGEVYGFIITLYWIVLYGILTKKYSGIFKHAEKLFFGIIFICLIPLLFHEIIINKFIVVEEAKVEKSCALAVGKYISTNSQLHDAIIIGSPEYSLEPISFYSGNRIYLAQEKTFRNFVRFSRQFEKTSSLMALIETAQELNSKYNVPVLIILGHFGMTEGKTFPTIYRGNFNSTNIEEFKKKTVKLAEFNNSLGDEKFQMFLYAPEENLRNYKAKYMELR